MQQCTAAVQLSRLGEVIAQSCYTGSYALSTLVYGLGEEETPRLSGGHVVFVFAASRQVTGRITFYIL